MGMYIAMTAIAAAIFAVWAVPLLALAAEERVALVPLLAGGVAFVAFADSTFGLAAAYQTLISRSSHEVWRRFAARRGAKVPSRNRLLAVGAVLGGAGVPVLLFLAYGAIAMEAALGGVGEAIVRVGLIAAALGGMYLLFRVAYVNFLPDPIAFTASDGQDLTLLLRSFADDRRRYGGGVRSYRLETLLNWELGSAATFVAIGDPSEWSPQVGAMRTYSTNETWQDVFRRFVERSSTIVAVAGETPWIRWELEELGRLDKLDKLIIVYPDADPAAKLKLIDMTCAAIPALPAAQLATAAAELRCVAFRPGTGPVIVGSKSATKNGMRAAIAVALGAHDAPVRTAA